MAIAASKAAAAARVVGDQPEILEALGLRPYWGHDTTAGLNSRGKKKVARREPDIVPDEYEEDVRLNRRSYNSYGSMSPSARLV